MNQSLGNTSTIDGTQKKRLFVIDESDTPIMVNVADLIKVRNCGPKRAIYIYEHLPLTHWDTFDSGVLELEENQRLMKGFSGSIILELVANNNRDIGEFDIRSVVLKHIHQKTGIIWQHHKYMMETHDLTHEEIKHHLYEWWVTILQEEKSTMMDMNELTSQ